MPLTKDEKAALLAKVKPLQADIASIEQKIETQTKRLHELREQIDTLYEQAGVDGFQVVGICESCRVPLFEGDLGYSDTDGPILCEEHAFSLGELQELVESEPEAFENPVVTQAFIDKKLAEGKTLDDKHVYPL